MASSFIAFSGCIISVDTITEAWLHFVHLELLPFLTASARLRAICWNNNVGKDYFRLRWPVPGSQKKSSRAWVAKEVRENENFERRIEQWHHEVSNIMVIVWWNKNAQPNWWAAKYSSATNFFPTVFSQVLLQYKYVYFFHVLILHLTYRETGAISEVQ